MPFSKWTVSKSIKESKEKPRSSCEQEADEIQSSAFLPDPSEQVEDYETGMKNCKEDIKCLVSDQNIHFFTIFCKVERNTDGINL